MQHPKLLLAFSLLTLTAACRRPDPLRLQPTIEEPPALASLIRMADPATATQLLRGFYPVEQNAWRWSAPKFSVVLGAPLSASKKGAGLVLKFSLIDPEIASLKRLTLSAIAGNAALAPETYIESGEHEYRRDVPAAIFSDANINVNFSLDKFFKTESDDRQLGLIVTSVALEAK
jgi:hypothetical protein